MSSTGIVIVSHSKNIAQGIVDLISEVAFEISINMVLTLNGFLLPDVVSTILSQTMILNWVNSATAVHKSLLHLDSTSSWS